MSRAAYTNLTKPRNTTSGIAENAWLAFAEDFLTIQCPPATGTKEERYTIKTAHVFKDATNKFMKFRLVPGKNNLSLASAGDTGLQRLTSTLVIFVPGSYIEAHATIQDMINQPLIVLAKDAECSANQYYQLGCECTGAYLAENFTTGTTVDGVKGYECTITYTGAFAYYDVAGGPDTLADGESTPVDDDDTEPEGGA